MYTQDQMGDTPEKTRQIEELKRKQAEILRNKQEKQEQDSQTGKRKP